MEFKQYVDIKWLTEQPQWKSLEAYMEDQVKRVKSEFMVSDGDLKLLQSKGKGIELMRSGLRTDLKIHENKAKET